MSKTGCSATNDGGFKVMILTKFSRLLAEKGSREEGTLESSKHNLQLI